MRGALFTLAGLLWLGGSTAEAGRIHHFAVPKPPPPTHRSFASFLAAGPSFWAHATPRIPRGLAIPRNADGTFAPGLFLDYLLYRRALNPVRFDRHHPIIGPELASVLPPLPPVSVPVAAPQTVGPPPLTPAAQQQVLEPSGLLIGGVILAGVAFVKRRRSREGG
jgi:hypothetical protein